MWKIYLLVDFFNASYTGPCPIDIGPAERQTGQDLLFQKILIVTHLMTVHQFGITRACGLIDISGSLYPRVSCGRWSL
jgi:hypothetical protein